MIKIKVLDEEYDVIDSWSDITLREFIEIQKLCDNAPKKLQKLLGHVYLGQTDEIESMEFSDREQLKTFPKFYGNMLGLVSSIPKKIINQIDFESRQQFFNTYLLKFAIGALYTPVDIPDVTVDSFDFEGDTYVLPKSRNVLGEERPMGYASTVQFTEASDIDIYMRDLDKKDYSVLANIVSILCLKEGEEYDEETCLRRAEKFMELKMDIVWDVFFYLGELLDTFTKATLNSSLVKVKLSMREQLKRQALINMDGIFN
jgi:hypothetical protein